MKAITNLLMYLEGAKLSMASDPTPLMDQAQEEFLQLEADNAALKEQLDARPNIKALDQALHRTTIEQAKTIEKLQKQVEGLRGALVAVRGKIYDEHDPDIEIPHFIQSTNAIIDEALEGGE